MMNKIKSFLQSILLVCLSIICLSCDSGMRQDYLKQGFINPPDSARPGVYWYFMDGNINAGAMTEDLESMKKAGIGYVLFLEVNVGIPRGNIDFLSEEWQDLYKHAVREAERLGIRIILGSGPGWAGSGGPWVTPSLSMMHLVASDTTISGPCEFNDKLPVPEPMAPFFGERSLTPSLKQLRDGWYEDVCVLAFPAPETPMQITQIEEKALYYRAPFTSMPGVVPFIPAPAVFIETPGSAIEQCMITDITDKLMKDGTLQWKIPAGSWTILRFVKRNNGAVTRPAPAPGLGFEADKFDTASFGFHYRTYIGKLVNKVNPVKQKNGGGWTMIHIDSWEMGSQNWSPRFREEFIKRRGYDPLLFLPVYTGLIVNSKEVSERFLWDIRQTSNELIVENHAGRFRELGRENGFRLSIEPYDMNPAADLDLGSIADVPMCEFWSNGFGFNSSFSCIEATSIAHTKGVPVVAAEAFTGDGTEAWKKYPANMKNQGDWAFCMGINRLIYHTFAHKAFSDKLRPGMTMGPYGVHWDRGQTWWPMAEGYHKYISRCQFVLSQGKAVADILYLTPEGAPQVFLPPPSALEGTAVMPDKKGYSFDGCSPLNLIKNASVKDGLITFPGGVSYRIMVLPKVLTMTPELVTKIGLLVESGATIIGNPPVKSPSLVNFPECDEKVKELSLKIWGSFEIPEGPTLREFGKGKIWWGEKFLKTATEKASGKDTMNLFPEYEMTSDLLINSGLNADFISSGNIRYTHRSLPDRDIYFISNRRGSFVSDTCKFRDASLIAELWDPVTGEISKLNPYSDPTGTFAVPVKLDAFQSFFVVFYNGNEDFRPVCHPTVQFIENQKLLTLDGRWDVSFDTAWGGPEMVPFDSLYDWSQSSADGIRYYSGIATYRTTFDLTIEKKNKKNARYFINFGTLKHIGRISLNGKDLGVIWTAPWQVDITDLLRNTGNTLEVEVANLWLNRLIGDESRPWDGIENGQWPEWIKSNKPRNSKRFTFTTYRYYKKDDPLQESGLIGPVQIIKKVW